MISSNYKMNPFPGLRPFTQEEDYLFFGREEQTLELLARLGSQRFVAVVGASGSGKSSLVRCGLLSELQGGKMLGAGASWEIAVTHPGGNPMALLTEALLDADLYDRGEENSRENLLATLSRSHFGLVEAVKQAGLAEDTNFLLVVDQFEEIFRFHEAGQTQQEMANEFVSMLLEAAAQKEVPIYVVLTMRSDFIGECGQFEGLAEMVNRGEFLIPRLSREQYKRIIEGPIRVAGGQIAPRLLQRLLNDLGQQTDQLPCLQHALMRTWNVWAEKGVQDALDLDDYQRVGKMTHALSLHADEIYDSLASDRQRQLCRGLFQALTVQESESRGIRRPQRLGRLCQILDVSAEELLPIIDAYRQKGVTFLMPGPEVELTDRMIIDISHESLMRVWTRLRNWVDEEAQAAGIYLRLSESAALYEQGKAGLYRDPELGIALAWQESHHPNAAWAERYRPGFHAAMAFLAASQQAAVAEEQSREAARQRELEQARQLAEAQKMRLEHQKRATRKLRKMLAGLAVVALIAGVACVAALVARNEASRLAKVAEDEADHARQNEEKANENAQRAERSQKETADALAVVESQKAKAEVAERVARDAEEKGRKLLYTTDMRLAPFVWRDDRSTAEQLRVLLAKHIPPTPFPLSHRGRGKGEGNVLAADAKPDLRGFEWHYFQHLLQRSALVFAGHDVSVTGGAFTSNGQLMTLDQNGQVRRWDLGSGDEEKASRRDLPGGASAQVRILSPNGRLAAFAEGNKVRVFDISTGKETFQIESNSVPTRRLIFSRDNDRMVIVDDKIRWVSAASGAVIASLNQQFGRIATLALSRDGLTIAIVGHGNFGNQLSIFRLDTTAKKVTPLAKNVGADGTLHASALSPDGRRIAVGAKLGASMSVYDTGIGRLLAQHHSAHASPIMVMAFSADGTKLATADVEGTIKVWADPPKLNSKSAAFVTLKGHQGAITAIDFSSDDKQLATTSVDKTARVWDLENAGAAIRPLEGTANMAPAARFSPDGQLITVAGGRSVRLWDAATGRKVRELPAVDKGYISSLSFSPADHRLLAVGYGGQADVSYVALWDIDAGRELARLPGATDLPDFPTNERSRVVGALAFSPDGKYLVAGFGSKNMLALPGDPTPLKVWEVATRRLIRRLSGHTGYCLALDFSPDGKWVASGSRDGTAILWSTATWKATHTLQNPDANTLYSGRGMFESVAFSPDSKTLALASREATVQLWDVATGKFLEPLRGHSSAVLAVAFSPDGRTLASGSVDQTVRLWNVQTRSELLQLDPGSIELDQVIALAFSPDGKQLLAVGDRAAFWFAAPNVWNDPDRAAEKLRQLLQTNADFPGRIRMLSENLRLHEALAKLEAKDVRAHTALAATQANWHASRQAWPQAVKAFDLLVAADPTEPEAWLRTPGLLRVATALLHQNRPRDAAALLKGGAKRRALDGLPEVVDRAKFGVIQFIDDPATGELLNPLRAAIATRLAKEPRNPALLELRAELAGQWSDTKAQIADYTAAIDILSPLATLPPRVGEGSGGGETAAVDLKRLYGRRGNAYIALKQWQQAVDDYARAVTDATTDDDLLTNQALALSELLLSSKTSERWTVVKPVEAKSELGATLSILPDDSILASGANPLNDRYRVVLTVPKDIDLAAVRLEALTHPSLPGNGPGRNRGRFRGSFGQDSWNVLAALPDRKDPIKLEFDQAWADHQMNAYPINKYGHWNIAGAEGKNATAIWSMAKPVSLKKGTKLTFEMQCHTFNATSESLGHFRLSVSSDPAAIELEQKYGALTTTDPWQKLAAAYQLQGNQQAIDHLVERRPKLAGSIGDLFTQGKDGEKDWQRAVEIYSKGIMAQTTDAELFSKRARAYERLKKWDAAAADWWRAVTGNPDEARRLTEFAGRLAVAGQVPLANAQFDKAQALYERSLAVDPENDAVATELAELLLTKHENGKSKPWEILQPTEMKSEGGATLKLLEDGSVLAGGPNPDHDSYTLVCPTSLPNIVAVRLEALPDPSLPHNGPGRAQENGNLALSEWRVTVEPQKPGDSLRVIRWKDAWSDHRLEAAQHYNNRPMDIKLAIDGDSKTYWETWPRGGSPHSAIFLPEKPISPEQGSKLKFSLDFRSEEIGHNLGRFRLSVSGDPAALEQEQNRFSVRKATDPWLRLATAYGLNGRTDKALPYFSRALQRADGYEARKPIVELAAFSDEVLSALIQRQPDDAQFQLALARRLAERGKQRLADKQPAKAQTELEKSREIFTRFRAGSPWAVLTPTELKSQGGETLTVEKDSSIFVSGPTPNRAVYKLKVRTDLPTLTAIRLETIPDARLPQGGAGRYSNGNWHVSEFTAAIVPAPSPYPLPSEGESKARGADAKPIPLEFGSAMADDSQDSQTGVANCVDGDPRTRWDTYPRMKSTHWAVFILKSPARMDGGSLSITLDSGITPWGMHGLGRFRLSATNDADLSRAVVRNDLKDDEVVDLSIALANAHAQQRRLNEAVSLFTEALDLATDHAAKAKIIAAGAALEGVLEKLAEHAAGDVQFQAGLALHYAERGNAPLADAARVKVNALFEQKLAKEPENIALAADLLAIFQSAGRTREAIPYLAEASAVNPKNSLLSLMVAALQAWFGQDKELAATRKQILASAKGTSVVYTAERAAKACSIRAAPDKADLEAALALGRKAVELGHGGEWNLVALGMAEYRSGNYRAADKALRDAVEAGPNNPFVTNCSAFYRAMILFRQGQRDEARKLAIAAAAKMQPLPKDDNNPLAGGAYHDDLILWLAYKEARALIEFDATAPPKEEKDTK